MHRLIVPTALIIHQLLGVLLLTTRAWIVPRSRFACVTNEHSELVLRRLQIIRASGTTSSSTTTSPSSPTQVVIVGGGVGGLAIASRIASASNPTCNITILEKNEQMGGRCGSFEAAVQGYLGTFRHERGPSLLLLPQVYQELFQDCGRDGGSSAEDYGLEMVPCVPAYQAIFNDGVRIDVGFPRRRGEDDSMSPAELESRRIMDLIEPNGALKWDEYMEVCQAYLDCGLPNFIEEKLDLGSFPAFLRESLRNNGRCWPLKPHSDVLDDIFESDKMRSLASFQDLYVGLEPYTNDKKIAGGIFSTTAPAVFGLLAAIELHPTNKKCGVFAPIGGFQKVTDSFEKLARDLGVSFVCGKTVTKVTEDGVYCCETSSSGKPSSPSEYVQADLVIVNADLPYASKVLLEEDDDEEGNGSPPNNYPKFDWDVKGKGRPVDYLFSSGVIAFHWSLSHELNDLNTHNVFLASKSRAEAEQSWEVLRNEEPSGSSSSLDASNFYVHRPSKVDPSAAPKGCDSILVLVPCDPLSHMKECSSLPKDEAIQKYKAQITDAYVDRVRDAVLRRMAVTESLSEIRSHIVDEVVDTPASYADSYNLAGGTPFALSHGFSQLSLTRPGPASSSLSNVVMVGASSRPGNGVPLVLVGAKQAAKVACEKIRDLSQCRDE